MPMWALFCKYPVMWKLAEYYDKGNFPWGFLSFQDMSETLNVLLKAKQFGVILTQVQI